MCLQASKELSSPHSIHYVSRMVLTDLCQDLSTFFNIADIGCVLASFHILLTEMDDITDTTGILSLYSELVILHVPGHDLLYR